MTGYVYFVKPVGQAGPIKIGHSTYPPARLNTLQTWSPVELELVSSFQGSLATEKAVHERFAKWQVRGEWFEPVPELVALMGGIRDGGKLEDLVDLTVKAGKLYRRPNTKSEKAKVIGSFKKRVDAAMRFAKERTGAWPLSEQVAVILNSAGGYRREYRELTPDEIETLEDFIRSCRAVSDLGLNIVTKQSEVAA